MEKYTFKATYAFSYRFRCEHCGQTTPWLYARFEGKKEYQSAAFEEKEVRVAALQEYRKQFHATTVPLYRQEVEDGKYGEVHSAALTGGLDGRCPNCQKRQSWEKVPDIGIMYFGMVLCGLLAWLGWGMLHAEGKGKTQLAGLIIGVLGATGFLLSLYWGISGTIRRAVVARDRKNVTVRYKPEFNWPENK